MEEIVRFAYKAYAIGYEFEAKRIKNRTIFLSKNILSPREGELFGEKEDDFWNLIRQANISSWKGVQPIDDMLIAYEFAWTIEYGNDDESGIVKGVDNIPSLVYRIIQAISVCDYDAAIMCIENMP